ncbi:hypothetical protein GOBAR_DD28902 [Gossypium barbadense]|nr:hypothetical protein GOBAR_DD28902 [Gossypium barbadense]
MFHELQLSKAVIKKTIGTKIVVQNVEEGVEVISTKTLDKEKKSSKAQSEVDSNSQQFVEKVVDIKERGEPIMGNDYESPELEVAVSSIATGLASQRQTNALITKAIENEYVKLKKVGKGIEHFIPQVPKKKRVEMKMKTLE